MQKYNFQNRMLNIGLVMDILKVWIKKSSSLKSYESWRREINQYTPYYGVFSNTPLPFDKSLVVLKEPLLDENLTTGKEDLVE